ncbi:MAG: hypothetical protein LBO00_03650 [Zoogloeaceae bacterium]|nr:hypothetical protein [Zoogloeaceae bacterium]
MNLQSSLLLASSPGAFDFHFLLALIAMIVAGGFGGLIHHHLGERQFGGGWHSLWRDLALGLFTALTLPLFLVVLSSPLLENIRVRATDLYVFFAFGLVYVVAILRIFGNLAYRKKLLQLEREVALLREEQDAVRRYVESIIAANEAAAQAHGEEIHSALTYNDVALLKALAEESCVYGNLAALAERTALGRDLIHQRLALLRNLGLIDTRIQDKNILHWVISSHGRQAIADFLSGAVISPEGERDAHGLREPA